MRRILSLLDISGRQMTVLLLLGVAGAGFEAVGVSLLFPVLRYVERTTAGTSGPTSGLDAMLARIAEASGLSVLLVSIVIAFLPVLGRQGFRYVHQVYAESLRFEAIARLRREAFAAFLDARLSFVLAQGQGRLMGVVTTETERGAAVLPLFLQLSEAVILVGAYLILLLALAPWLVPLVLLAIAAVGLVVRTRIRYARAYGERIAMHHDALHVAVAEKLAGIRLIKMRGQEARETSAVGEIADLIKRMFARLCREREGIEVSIEPLMILGVFVTLYVAVARFGMTLASLGIFMFVLLRLVPLLKQVNVARQNIGSLLGGLENVRSTIDSARAERDLAGGVRAFPGLHRELAFEHVGFSYGDADDAWALHDISFRVEKGSITAIVGRSGAGKSTVLDLIPRLRDVTGGEITVDGVPIREFELKSLRSAIGVVDQEGFLFDDTVANNIAYGLADVSRARIVAAARGAHADGFIEALPQGYETLVGERGVRLSVGQRQRISLARVLLQDPDILLLDEPTSALDSESEQYIRVVLDELRASKAIIVVAHRLSTIRRADQILVLDDGRIVERGDHESLLRDLGTYKRLFELQIQV
jgi:subfamily B ATP-binding cassette protein MsbA